MKILFKVIYALILLLALSALIVVYLSKTLIAPEQRVDGLEALRLIAPLKWVRPARLLSAESTLILRGRPPFQTLEAGTENPLFITDASDFMRAQNATSFSQAQMDYFSRMTRDEYLNRSDYEAPHLSAWGALPYPPIREIGQLHKPLPLRLQASSWAMNPSYQQELDRITGHELTKNESVDLFQNGAVVGPILKVIYDSNQFVFVNLLSLVCDASTEPVIHALEERAQMGVDVRVILNRGYSLLDSGCLKRLRAHQIQIVTAPTHSSYYVNDREELMLGAESMARMFFKSDGYNFLDRDLMISIKGPVATDVIKNFVTVWDENRSADLRDVKRPVAIYLSKRASELKAGLRARDAGGFFGSGPPHGLCRFAEQLPKGENRSMENLLVSLANHSKQKIFLSGVKFDRDSPLFKESLARAAAGVDFRFLGNGWEGGDGELTLYLDELIRDHSELAPFLRAFRNWDVNRVAHKRAQAAASLEGVPHVELWSFYSFLHYKLALFDQVGAWVGSANPDWDSVTEYDESGVFCMDEGLIERLANTTEIDLANSIPVSTLRR